MANTIKLRRGLAAARTGITPAVGEPIYTTDDNRLFVGDGSTLGGIELAYAQSVHNHVKADITDFSDADYATAAQGVLADNAIPISQKGAASGVTPLIDTVYLPPITITDSSVVASQVAMLALTAQTGDVAVRTDLNTSYILQGTDPTILGDWLELLSPLAVTSVASGTGLTGGPITSSGTLSLAVDQLAEKTGAVVGTDRLVGTSGTTNFAETISGIPLSIFTDDLGHVENVSTALSTGTVSATTYGITSDGGADDIILAGATTLLSGVMSAAKFNEERQEEARVIA